MLELNHAVRQIGPAYRSNDAGDGPEKTRDHRFWFPRFKSNWLGTFRSRQMFPCCECALPVHALAESLPYRYRGSDQKHCSCGADQWHLARKVEEDEHNRRAEISKLFDSARYDEVMAHLRLHTELQEYQLERMKAADCYKLKVSRRINIDEISKSKSLSSLSTSRVLERRRSDSNLLHQQGKRTRSDHFKLLRTATSLGFDTARFLPTVDSVMASNDQDSYWKVKDEPESLQSIETLAKGLSILPETLSPPTSLSINETHDRQEHLVMEEFISTLLQEPEMKTLLAQSPRSLVMQHHTGTSLPTTHSTQAQASGMANFRSMNAPCVYLPTSPSLPPYPPYQQRFRPVHQHVHDYTNMR